MTVGQLEFSLRVVICAWCKPKERGSGAGSLSHGICPRHLQKMKLELKGLLPKRRRRAATHSSESAPGLDLLLPF
ncbi:MAG: hypothetical protein HY298_14425 [Verrucomicrobia bacterium]|nr:hypothetical protein [Verrucomicrobiota bacterium]